MGNTTNAKMASWVVKPLLCFGEAIIDFLNTGFTSVDGLELADFRQFPGGAPANFVKFSREVIALLANGDEERYVEDLLAGMTRLIVVTDGAGPVEYFWTEMP